MATEIAGDVSGITEAVATYHHHSEWLMRLQGDVSGLNEALATDHHHSEWLQGLQGDVSGLTQVTATQEEEVFAGMNPERQRICVSRIQNNDKIRERNVIWRNNSHVCKI